MSSGRDGISMSPMLAISGDILPNNAVSFLAFRLACLDTLERMVLARQFDAETADGFGFLTEVPFLRSVPPQVQLDRLSLTWHKHTRTETRTADLVDESVVYAACETAARVVQQDREQVRLWMQNGPAWIAPRTKNLSNAIRNLHLSLRNEGDFLVISQFEDLAPRESLRRKAKFGLEPGRCEALFEALSQWHVTPGFAGRLTGLLTDREIAQAVALVKPPRVATTPKFPT